MTYLLVLSFASQLSTEMEDSDGIQTLLGGYPMGPCVNPFGGA